MGAFRLIDIDRTENAVLRRKLRPWMASDAARLRPLVREVLQRHHKAEWADADFRWETHVYPLFYYGWTGGPESQVYERITDRFCEEFRGALAGRERSDQALTRGELLPLITSVANAEIDLLIESADYFMFIEAKTPPAGHPAHFQRTGKMHQLVRQLVEGRMLSRLIGKEFMLATLGCGGDRSVTLEPNPTERTLLDLVGASWQSVPNLSWDVLPEDKTRSTAL